MIHTVFKGSGESLAMPRPGTRPVQTFDSSSASSELPQDSSLAFLSILPPSFCRRFASVDLLIFIVWDKLQRCSSARSAVTNSGIARTSPTIWRIITTGVNARLAPESSPRSALVTSIWMTPTTGHLDMNVRLVLGSFCLKTLPTGIWMLLDIGRLKFPANRALWNSTLSKLRISIWRLVIISKITAKLVIADSWMKTICELWLSRPFPGATDANETDCSTSIPRPTVAPTSPVLSARQNTHQPVASFITLKLAPVPTPPSWIERPSTVWFASVTPTESLRKGRLNGMEDLPLSTQQPITHLMDLTGNATSAINSFGWGITWTSTSIRLSTSRRCTIVPSGLVRRSLLP